MIFQTFLRIAATVAMISTGIVFASEDVCAQVIDFSQIDAFESMGTGTLHGASEPKTISVMMKSTPCSSLSGRLTLTPRFIGNRRMKTCPGQVSYMLPACRHFKPLGNLSLKPSATKITVSSMDTCCFVSKSNRKVVSSSK